MKFGSSASGLPLRAKTSEKREAGRARKLRCDLFQPWISAPHRRPRERSAASRVEYRLFKKGNAAERTRAFPSSHTAHQFIRSVEKSSEGSHPRRASCRVLGKRPRLYADRDETEGWKLCFILIRVSARDVFRRGARARPDRENERDGKHGHVDRKWQWGRQSGRDE